MADTNLGFVASKKLSDSLTDSQTHQGKIYFPTDASCIVKNNKKFGVATVDEATLTRDEATLQISVKDSGITTAKIAKANVTKEKLDTNVQSSLSKADTALQSHQDISGKQDVISDLATIRSGASKGATAVQPTQMESISNSEIDTEWENAGMSETDLNKIETLVAEATSASITSAQSASSAATSAKSAKTSASEANTCLKTIETAINEWDPETSTEDQIKTLNALIADNKGRIDNLDAEVNGTESITETFSLTSESGSADSFHKITGLQSNYTYKIKLTYTQTSDYYINIKGYNGSTYPIIVSPALSDTSYTVDTDSEGELVIEACQVSGKEVRTFDVSLELQADCISTNIATIEEKQTELTETVTTNTSNIATLNSDVLGTSETKSKTLITDGTVNELLTISDLDTGKKYKVTPAFTLPSTACRINILVQDDATHYSVVKASITSGTLYEVTTTSYGVIVFQAIEEDNPGNSFLLKVNISTVSLKDKVADIETTIETDDLDGIAEKVTDVIVKQEGANLVNPDTITQGEQLNATTGNTYSNTSAQTTDYVSVTENTTLYLQANEDKSYTFVVICYYNEDKEFISSTQLASVAVTTPDECAYIRISAYYTATKIMCSYENVNYEAYVSGYTLSDHVKEDLGISTNTKSEVTVMKSGGDYTKLIDAISYAELNARKNSPVTIHIYEGSYDLYNELGGLTFIQGITSSENQSAGIKIPGYTSIIGHGNVYLNYLPSDQDIISLGDNGIYPMKCVSGLNISENVTLENLTITVKNARYAVHDETGGTYYPNCEHTYINCKLEHKGNYSDRTYSETWISCAAIAIGASTGNHYSFVNCVFTSSSFWSWSIHDNNNVGGLFIEFDGCEFTGHYTLRGKTCCGKLAAYLAKGGTHKVYFKNCICEDGTQWVICTETQETPQTYYVDNRFEVHNFTEMTVEQTDD